MAKSTRATPDRPGVAIDTLEPVDGRGDRFAALIAPAIALGLACGFKATLTQRP